MQITNCKLSKRVKKKLLEFFCTPSYRPFRCRYFGHSAQLRHSVLPQNPHGHQPSLALAADEVFEGSIELDESYFGGWCKGRRGRGAAGKVVVFLILKRNGRVYTVVVDNSKSNTLMTVIKQKIMPDSIVYTDSLAATTSWT